MRSLPRSARHSLTRPGPRARRAVRRLFSGTCTSVSMRPTTMSGTARALTPGSFYQTPNGKRAGKPEKPRRVRTPNKRNANGWSTSRPKRPNRSGRGRRKKPSSVSGMRRPAPAASTPTGTSVTGKPPRLTAKHIAPGNGPRTTSTCPLKLPMAAGRTGRSSSARLKIHASHLLHPQGLLTR